MEPCEVGLESREASLKIREREGALVPQVSHGAGTYPGAFHLRLRAGASGDRECESRFLIRGTAGALQGGRLVARHERQEIGLAKEERAGCGCRRGRRIAEAGARVLACDDWARPRFQVGQMRVAGKTGGRPHIGVDGARWAQ